MMKLSNYNFTIILLIIFICILHISFAYYAPALADDLTHYATYKSFINGELSTSDIFQHYLSDPNRYARPMSAVTISLSTILSKPSYIIFFSFGLLLIIYLLLLKNVLEYYFPIQKNFILLVLVLVTIFPFSSSTNFSVIMNTGLFLVIGVFLLVLICIRNEKNRYHLFAGILLSISFLAYEQNVFLLPLIVILTIYHHKNSYLKKILLSIGISFFIFVLYRLVIMSMIFPSDYDYVSAKLAFGLGKSIELIASFVKLFTTDYVFIIYKSILAISDYGIVDLVLLLLGSLISFLIVREKNTFQKIEKKQILFISVFFACTVLVFYISYYPPIAFGFENRMFTLMRFSYAMVLGSILYMFISSKFGMKFRLPIKIGIFLLLMSNFIAIISQKNSWISASEYNKTAIKNIAEKFPENQQEIKVIYLSDREKKKKLITDESVLEADYEINAAQKLYTNANFIPQNIVFSNPADYSLYELFGIKFNKRPKSKFEVSNEGVKVGKHFFAKYPFYIFDERDGTVT